MQRAAVVFHSTEAVRREIERYDLVSPDRLVHAPYGISEEFASVATGADPAAMVCDAWGNAPFLLHVGSCIPRKRIDVLLDVFARVRSERPDLLLVHLGGEWTMDQRKQIQRLQIESAVRELPAGQTREMIAGLYRRAEIVLLPSESEGFGLPVAEGLACGAIVVASDIPVLREVGGSAAIYCPVGDIGRWSETVLELLVSPQMAPDLTSRLTQAAGFSWRAHAATVLAAYERVLR